MNLLATMRADDDTRGTVRVEDVYATDPDDLWQACTDPDRLGRWIAEVSGDLRVGGTVQVAFVSSWTGPGRVEVCEPSRHLLLTMGPGEDDETQIEAWLTVEGDGTRLVVEERGLPLGEIAAHGSGWQAHLEDLGRSLRGEPSAWQQRWSELIPAYRELEISR